MSSDLDIYSEQEWDYPRERLYRSKREIFQDAEVSLIDTLYHELKAKLVALGLDKAVLDGLHYQDKYHDDEATLASLASVGIEPLTARLIVRESKAHAEGILREAILAKGFPEKVVPSVLQYIAVVRQVDSADATNETDEPCRDAALWARQQMYQLGAAGENCPADYLASVIDAATFLIANHPQPTDGVFHLYKRYSHADGYIHLREVIAQIEEKGAKPNHVRAILNLHRHYGAQMGPAFLAILQKAPQLMSYEGGVLQLVADFADHGFSPTLQEGIVSQVGNHIEYQGGALQLSVDLAARHISPGLQNAIVKSSYHVGAYPGGMLKLAEDVTTGHFAESAEANVVRSLAYNGDVRRSDAPQYIQRLAELYAINPVCIDAKFTGSPYNEGNAYYSWVVAAHPDLTALAVDTSAEKLPYLADPQRGHLFCKLLEIMKFPRYALYREAAFSLAHKAADWQGDEFVTAIDQLATLGHSFETNQGDTRPKGAIHSAPLLVEDLVTIVQSAQPGILGRWYFCFLYEGGDRVDAMTVIKVPFVKELIDYAQAIKPYFEVIAGRFLGEDQEDRKRLTPIVRCLLRETGHYALERDFGEMDQPMGLICRYVFGVGPAVERGLSVADIAMGEAVLDGEIKNTEQFDDALQLIERVSVVYADFGEKIRGGVRSRVVEAYRDAIGRGVAVETPIEWAFDYMKRDASLRSREEAEVLAHPSHGTKVSLSLLQEMIKVAQRLALRYPTQSDRFQQFVISLFWRHDANTKSFEGGVNATALLASDTQVAGIVRLGVGDTLTAALALATNLEVPNVVAHPGAIPALAPPRLSRATALVAGRRLKGTPAGRLLSMLGESVSVKADGVMAPDDDVSFLWRTILESRIARPGFPIMGAKLHVNQAVQLDLVNQVISQLGLGSSSFSTIHAGMTLLMPPGQPVEIKLLLNYLKFKGLFTERDFDMQACIGGRLRAKKHIASIGVVNALMLLATKAMPNYKVDAWRLKESYHNDATNAYIMAYGAGVRQRGGAYDLLTEGDRTDMLGRRDLGDLDLYQIIATLIMHYEDGGYFADLGEELIRQVIVILQRYRLYDAMFDAPWVFEPGVTSRTANNTTQKHWEMVEKFTAMRIVSESAPRLGITGEVRHVIKTVYDVAASRFEQIQSDVPSEFEKLCAL